MKTSLKKRIELTALNRKGWIHGGQIERMASMWGYKPSNASRRCRELENDGILKKKYNKKGEVLYIHEKYYKPQTVLFS